MRDTVPATGQGDDGRAHPKGLAGGSSSIERKRVERDVYLIVCREVATFWSHKAPQFESRRTNSHSCEPGLS